MPPHEDMDRNARLGQRGFQNVETGPEARGVEADFSHEAGFGQGQNRRFLFLLQAQKNRRFQEMGLPIPILSEKHVSRERGFGKGGQGRALAFSGQLIRVHEFRPER